MYSLNEKKSRAGILLTVGSKHQSKSLFSCVGLNQQTNTLDNLNHIGPTNVIQIIHTFSMTAVMVPPTGGENKFVNVSATVKLEFNKLYLVQFTIKDG